MLPAAYKMEPETPRVSGADELDRCIERVAMCDRDAFAVLYRSTSGAVFAYALSVLKNRQDAEDVLHDCYVNIYQTAQAYRSEGKPMAWIMTVTRNLCLHKLRERSRRAEARLRLGNSAACGQRSRRRGTPAAARVHGAARRRGAQNIPAARRGGLQAQGDSGVYGAAAGDGAVEILARREENEEIS